MSQLELKIPPVLLWAAMAIASILTAHSLPQWVTPFFMHKSLAIALMLIGGLIALAGVTEFRRAKTTVNPYTLDQASSVVSRGIFSFTRNPMYLGMALSLCAIAIWYAYIPSFLFAAFFCMYITRFQIKPEERMLMAIFGHEYSSYLSRVRRWL